MRRIEIYGYLSSPRTIEAESFCRRMNYAHVVRGIGGIGGSRELDELRARGGSPSQMPQIFIGDELIGSLFDLIDLAPFIVQQKIGG